MKDFRRRLELRLLVQHETKMAQPASVFAPPECRRCGTPLPPTGRKGRPEMFCAGCKVARDNERRRENRARERSARRRELRELQACPEK